MDHGLRDLRADAADDALRSHHPHRGDGLDQVLRHQGIYGRHPGDVDDRDGGALIHDPLEQVLITICVRALPSVQISGTTRFPSHSFTTGVDSSSSSSCWLRISSSRRA